MRYLLILLLFTTNLVFSDLALEKTEYDPEVPNYSNRIVVVPDGTIIKNKNFTQLKQVNGADVIIGQNLTFIRCQMCNVIPDKSWIIEECNTDMFVDIPPDAKGSDIDAIKLEYAQSFAEVAPEEIKAGARLIVVDAESKPETVVEVVK